MSRPRGYPVNLLVLCAILACLSGCGLMLSAQSAPPPGRTAHLEAIDGFWGVRAYRLELSQGVAVAVSCNRGGPCQDVVVQTDDASIADVKGASIGTLDRAAVPGLANDTSSQIVVVGKAPGQTRVVLRSGKKTRTIHVTVVPPPALGAPSTRVAAERP